MVFFLLMANTSGLLNAWSGMLAFDVLIFFMTLLKCIHHRWNGGSSSIASVMFRDGAYLFLTAAMFADIWRLVWFIRYRIFPVSLIYCDQSSYAPTYYLMSSIESSPFLALLSLHRSRYELILIYPGNGCSLIHRETSSCHRCVSPHLRTQCSISICLRHIKRAQRRY